MDKKIAFLGTPNFAVPILKSIHQSNYKISCVFSQPPRKSNRGHKLNKSPIHLLSEELGIEIKTPENIKKEIDYIKSLNLDLAIVVAYGQILSKDIFISRFDIPRILSINLSNTFEVLMDLLLCKNSSSFLSNISKRYS